MTQKNKLKVGFIGLGNIGGPMAANLLDDSFSLTVFDVSEYAVQSLVARGASAATSAKELAQHSEIIGICVRDDRDVDAVLFGEHGVLAGAARHCVIAIHSTVTQDGLQRWHDAARARGVDLLDAPITGGAQGAQDKTLCYMVGGEQTLLERYRPVFETSGKTIIHAGGLGSGMALKLCNNLMTYAAFTAMHEAAKLAEACGLSLDVIHEVGQSNGVVTDQMYRFITNREQLIQNCSAEDFVRLFGPFGALGEKDLTAALESARQKGIELPATERIQGLIQKVFLKQY